MDAAVPSRSTNRQTEVEFARDVIRQEATTLQQLAERIGIDFVGAVERIAACTGTVVVMGMGKAGLIGQKISATLCSTGTRSVFLHPAEAIHGDLGRVTASDIVLAISQSGETEELVRVLSPLGELSIEVLAITARRDSTLGRAACGVLELGNIREADALGLAPSTSTTAMLALGDAIALTLSRRRGFTKRDFARFHPGGSLGRKLTRVQEMMRPLAECRVAHEDQSVRDVFVTLRCDGRRTGAVMIVDNHKTMVGVFTDSDLARLLEQQADSRLDEPVKHVMTRDARSVQIDTLMPEAIEMLATHQISELPVVDRAKRPHGMIDITDVVSWLPEPQAAPTTEKQDFDDGPRLLRFPESD